MPQEQMQAKAVLKELWLWVHTRAICEGPVPCLWEGIHAGAVEESEQVEVAERKHTLDPAGIELIFSS